MKFTIEALGFVASQRIEAEDDFWGGAESRITLAEHMPSDALAGLAEFSHIEVLFVFHRADERKIVRGARHPRNNLQWPLVGILAQRGKNRPNRIGSTLCRLVAVRDREILVAELDAIDGTPVIDIKPVMREFLPRRPVRQPSWSQELMSDYWSAPAGGA